jgi:hypothetical protein
MNFNVNAYTTPAEIPEVLSGRDLDRKRHDGRACVRASASRSS